MQVDLNKVVEEYASVHQMHMKASPVGKVINVQDAKDTLSAVISKLQSVNVPWLQILSMLGTILPLIFSGASLPAIIAAVLALLGNPTPAS